MKNIKTAAYVIWSLKSSRRFAKIIYITGFTNGENVEMNPLRSIHDGGDSMSHQKLPDGKDKGKSGTGGFKNMK